MKLSTIPLSSPPPPKKQNLFVRKKIWFKGKNIAPPHHKSKMVGPLLIKKCRMIANNFLNIFSYHTEEMEVAHYPCGSNAIIYSFLNNC